MSRRTPPLIYRSAGRRGQHGQTLVIFAIMLVAIIAFAGLLIDGGMAWGQRRQAQGAADTAALSAANALAAGGSPTTAAAGIAQANGFGAPGSTNCAGAAIPGNAAPGVQVNNPPVSGPHTGDANYVEVITTRAMGTTFSNVVGQSCWMVSARAVAVVVAGAVAKCSFCSLNNASGHHTLLLQNGSKLRVDGDIYVNSTNGCGTLGTGPGTLKNCATTTCTVKSWEVCGDGFDIFGTPDPPPAYISAKTISVVGGWETHDGNIVTADNKLSPPTYATTCPESPDPPEQVGTPSNVCIHMPPLVDPFGATPTPTQVSLGLTAPPSMTACATAPGTSGVKLPTGTSSTEKNALKITSGQWTLCPGMYYGGIAVSGAGTKIVMQPGVYFIVDNENATGFSVIDGASVDGSAGVMIYNSGTKGQVTINQNAEGIDIPPNPDLAIQWADGPPGTPPLPVGKLKADKTTVKAPKTVKFTFELKLPAGSTAPFTGQIDFYDGGADPGDAIPSCHASFASNTHVGDEKKECSLSFTNTEVGTHGISAVYHGDPVYGNLQLILSPRLIVTSDGTPGGTTLLSPLKSGPYKGYVIWQDKANLKTMYLSPESPLAACTGSWMTDGIPTTAPPPCGPLGGISGTIYAPGTPTSNGPQVSITASGLANLQVVANKMLITSGTDARFAFKPSAFASATGGLVE